MLWRALLVLVLLNGTADAQFKSETSLQSLAVQVTDSKGNPIPGLTAADFTLFEDGKPQQIAFFETGRQPVSLAVLLDSSRSMDSGGKLTRTRKLLTPLLRGNHDEDQIFFAPFTERLESFRQLTPEERRDPSLVNLVVRGQGTALYDSLASTLCEMKTAINLRQAIVVITDGADQHSRLNLNQLIRLTQSSNPQIFTIGFFDSDEYDVYRQRHKTITLVGEREIDNPLVVFERLAKESGAESFFPSSDRDLEKALARISSILEAQYTLAYYPANLDRFRKIEVRVKARGAKVVTRRGVGAEDIGTPVHFEAGSCRISPQDHPYPWEPHTTVDSSGTMTWRDDFSDSRSGWPNRKEHSPAPQTRTRGDAAPAEPYSPGIAYTAQGYEIVRHVPRNSSSAGPIIDGTLAASGPSWRDFHAEVTVEADWRRSFTGNGSNPNLTPLVTAGVLTTSAGVIFHLNGDGYYAFVLTGGVSKDEVHVKLVRATWTGDVEVLTPWTLVKTGSWGTEHRVSVEYKAGRIGLAVDGYSLPEVSERLYDSGLFGFALYGDGRAIYRNLKVIGH